MIVIVAALIGSGATGLISWVIMSVRSRRREKGDRFGDLRVDVNQRFAEHREDMNARFVEHREDMNARFAEHREDMNRRFDEQKADSERRFAAILDEIKGLEHRLANKIAGEIKALDTKFTAQLKEHGDRLARIEAKLEIDPPAEAA